MNIQSVAQLAERVRDAQQHNTPVYPYAGNTQQHQLAPASQTGLSLNLSGLNQLIDYPHQDMTITVQAGMTMDNLQGLLNEKQQTLPIDVPKSQEATVGGSIAANINGPRRTGWGTWRDYLIGLSWINDKGEECKAGGRVVKNVAGYDFCKLFIGSFGTLGIITQVTVKVKPRPEESSLIWCEIKKEQAGELTDLIRHSRLKPTLFVIEPDQKPTWIVKFGFEENAQAVNWQHDHLRKITQGMAKLHAVNEGLEGAMDIHDLVEFANAGESVTFEAHVPGSRCAEFSLQVQPLTQMMQTQPAVGIVIGHLSKKISFEEATKTIENIRTLATSMGGYVTLPRCPAQWRSKLHPFGPPRPDWPLMQKVKHAMDPNNIFQRGRHEILKTDN
ncbi:MAG: FAD-binding oxidoreductase [Gemmatales bacterium]